MRVLLLGGGAREHAIGWKLAQSSLLTDLVSCPGNPGLAELGRVIPDVSITDPAAVVDLARDVDADLVVVGPEAPLAAGVADALREAGIPVFGPGAAGAALEASKTFAKEVMAAAGVPTARSATYTDAESAYARLEETPGPYVIKADGLAAGKGVLVTVSLAQAQAWVDECLDGRFGDAGRQVLIEDHLEGDEISIFFVCSGGVALPMEPARDYKRLDDDDMGPNTGGMGCYSPVDDLPDDLIPWTRDNVALPVLDEMERRGIEYTGFLYVGLMLTDEGPKVLEFNCRLGDPETQVLMPRLETDFLELLRDAAADELHDSDLIWSDRAAVDVVLTAPGYPEDPEKGLAVIGTHHVTAALVFHAATAWHDDRLITAGGRVLNIVGVADSLEEARTEAYAAANVVQFKGKHFRSDIAAPVRKEDDS